MTDGSEFTSDSEPSGAANGIDFAGHDDLDGVIQMDVEKVRSHLDGVVSESVEATLTPSTGRRRRSNQSWKGMKLEIVINAEEFSSGQRLSFGKQRKPHCYQNGVSICQLILLICTSAARVRKLKESP